MPKPDWLWLAVGIIIGYIAHQLCTNPKSPVSNYIGTSPNQY